MLKDITTEDTIDKVSARGYALGYLVGGLQLLLSLAIIQLGPGMLGIDGIFSNIHKVNRFTV